MPPLKHFLPIAALGMTVLPLCAFAGETAQKGTPELANNVTKVLIQVIPNLVKFDTSQFDVVASTTVELTLKNGCIMPHNLVIVPVKAEQTLVNAVNLMGAEGFEKGFVPKVPEILFATKLLPSGGSEVLKFTAPSEPGDYLYVCTFPGHWFTMRGIMKVRAKGEKLEKTKREESKEIQVPDASKDSGITPTPIGTFAKPLIMRTFLPDPGLDNAVFAHHDTSKPAKKYDPATRQDIETLPAKSNEKDLKSRPLVVNPEAGIPGAIAVSHGPEFAYAWDTTECRLLYAWRGGFLDMSSYWGKGTGGGRGKFYIPAILGHLVYRTSGTAPLARENDPAPKFGGYRMIDNAPEFFYTLGSRTIRERVIPKADGGFELKVQIESPDKNSSSPPPTWHVSDKDSQAVKVESVALGRLTVHIKDRPEEAPKNEAKKSETKVGNE